MNLPMKFEEISQVIKICRGNFEVIATKFSQKFKWNILAILKHNGIFGILCFILNLITC